MLRDVAQFGREAVHPDAASPMFLPRLGYQQQKLVPLLVERGVTTTVAPLYYMDDNPELALVPAESQLGSVLDPSTHLRQLPAASRASAFRATPWGASPTAFDPDRDHVTDVELEQLAHGPIDLQRSRGATIVLTSFHVVGGPGTRGRDLDLLLARAGIAHFRAERIDQPPPFAVTSVPRQIFAALAVPIDVLRDRRAASRLAEAYTGLDADGLWVKIDGFHERASRDAIRSGGAFLGDLADAGKTIVSCGSGQLYLGLLASGISASIGIGESERFRFPTDWKAATDGRERKGRSRVAYHPALLRSFRVTSDSARSAFTRSRCRCRQHPANQPPTGDAIGPHAAICRADEARDALMGDVVERRQWVLGLATKASWVAADTGLSFTPPTTFNALFDGFDGRGRDAATVRTG